MSEAKKSSVKKCADCSESKSAQAFGLDLAQKDGLGRCCRECTANRARANYRKRAEGQGRTVREKVPVPDELVGSKKRCPDCGEVKPFSEFGRNKSNSDGCSFYCKPCYRARGNKGYRDRAEREGRVIRERVEAPEGSKWCPSCKSIKSHEKWDRNSRSKDGYCSHCKACRAERGARDYLRRTYGLAPEDVERMIGEQGGLCAVCMSKPAVHVDHDHESGEVRKVLCFSCNVMLGQAQDDPAVLLRAIAYLQEHNALATPGLPTWVMESRRGFILGA